MAPICGSCPSWDPIVLGDDFYVAGESRGRCRYCPPIPTGTYRKEYSQWPVTLAADQCGTCKCRGCSAPVPDPSFLLQENGDYILQESDDLILLE